MTHRRLLTAALAALLISPALAQTKPADAGVDATLERLNAAGQTMKSLRADVTMTTVDGVTGGDSKREGKILLERRGEGDTRGRVGFDKFLTGDRIITDRQEYLLDGDWVVDRVYRRPGDANGGNRETHRQIRQPGEKTDLLKLGAGPFPLPIGQPPAVVREQFDLKPLPADPKKPEMAGLELTPKASNALGKQFKSITVWLKQGESLPTVIETIDPQETTTQTTTLTNVVLNGPVTDADFKLEPIGDDWQIVKEPLQR